MGSRQRILFFGTPEFARLGLETLLKDSSLEVLAVVTQPDKAAGRGQDLRPSPVKQLAQAANIPVLQPRSIRKGLAEFLAEVAKLGTIDLGVVIAFGQILPVEVLKLPRCGCVNVHASKLPRWRGAAPIQRAIMAGDCSTAVALMDMEAGLDTGAVYYELTTPISDTDTFGSLHDRLAGLSQTLLSQKLSLILHSELQPQPQVSEGVTYASRIDKAEALINWNLPNQQVLRHVHGLSPFPGAYTFWQGKRLKVLRAEAKSDITERKAAPGTVSLKDSDRLEVQCASGVLSIRELQLEGKRVMAVKEFLAGAKVELGSVFEAPMSASTVAGHTS